MKTIHITTITIVLLIFVNIAKSQDVRYSQPFTNPLTLNPALMNINNDLKVILNHRSQWSTIDNGYTTSSFTGLYPVFLNGNDEKLDVGLNAIMDKAGAFNNINISLAVGYGLKVSKSSFLSLALSGGYIQKTLDVTGLTFDDQYVLGSYSASNQTGETVLNEKIGYPDVNFGLLWSIRPDDSKLNAYIGFSGFHVTEPKETFTGEDGLLLRKFSFQSGLKILGENKLDFTPNIIVTKQSGAEEVAAGLYMDYHLSDVTKLTAGGWYRKNDAFACVIKIEVMNFVLGYSYDIPNSELGRSVSGLNVHEISLIFKMNKSEDESASLL